jgi:hypothetical protein
MLSVRDAAMRKPNRYREAVQRRRVLDRGVKKIDFSFGSFGWKAFVSRGSLAKRKSTVRRRGIDTAL